VKSTILKAYARAYRQGNQRQQTQIFTEFAREKEAQFAHWCRTKEVTNDFGKLCQLILLKEFKSCPPPQVKTYLNVENLHQAVIVVDNLAKILFQRG